MRWLDLGCGREKPVGAIGLDIEPWPEVDVVHDFDVLPYPFPDDSFDRITCRSSLEHVADFVETVVELRRLLRPGGVLEVWCPHFSGSDAYRDPTHRTFFAWTTFDRFTGAGSYQTSQSGYFRMTYRTFGCPGAGGWVGQLLKRTTNAFPDLYEHRLSRLLPAKAIYYRLEAIKA